jgi:hypothetical protein
MDTFNNRYSTWFLPLTQKQKLQYERLEKLVLSFNGNLKEEVVRAKDKYNLKIRGVIAEKTGVSLTYRSKELDYREFDNRERANIPIKVVDRVPLSLLEIFDKFDDKHIELLLHYRRMKISASELIFQLKNYSEFSKFHGVSYDVSHLNDAILHLQKLIKEVEDSGIIDAIKNLGPDLLGAYFLDDNRVELYWLCIGLCNIIHNLPIEDFTLVVLTHELVHGYTHLGFDKDGNNWDTKRFCNADLRIIEGLAQFYTEILCKDYFDQASNAFNALLTEQASEYISFKDWFGEKEPDKYEKARRILLRTRTKKIMDYEEFLRHLELVKEDF